MLLFVCFILFIHLFIKKTFLSELETMEMWISTFESIYKYIFEGFFNGKEWNFLFLLFNTDETKNEKKTSSLSIYRCTIDTVWYWPSLILIKFWNGVDILWNSEYSDSKISVHLRISNEFVILAYQENNAVTHHAKIANSFKILKWTEIPSFVERLHSSNFELNRWSHLRVCSSESQYPSV